HTYGKILVVDRTRYQMKVNAQESYHIRRCGWFVWLKVRRLKCRRPHPARPPRISIEKPGKPRILEPTSRTKFIWACTRTNALLQAKVVVLTSDRPDDMKRRFMINPEL